MFHTSGEASRILGVPAHILRYWEKRLHLATYRSPGGRRLYRSADLKLLRTTAELLKQGYALGAIRERLRGAEESGESRLRALRTLRQDLAGLAELLSSGGRKSG